MTQQTTQETGRSAMDEHVERIARTPVLLVATDYDGTLSEIVNDPTAAHPNRDAIVALRALAAQPQTHVAVISGRSLKDLAELTNLPENVHLVGSHGSEFDADFATALTEDQRALRERVSDGLGAIAAEAEGLALEHKPASVALHFRNASRDAARAAQEAVASGLSTLDGVQTKHGKEVVELSVVTTDKGTALDVIRKRCGASATVFLGDDVTDEDAFATLGGPDLGVKVGDGETHAAYRVSTTDDVARQLARLSELRESWLMGEGSTPIDHLSFLSDQRAIACVTPRGRVNWFCAPRPDSASLFAELLGHGHGGHFDVRPLGTDEAGDAAYLGGSLVLRTSWERVSVTDFLDCCEDRPTQRPGRTDLVRVIEGDGPVEVEFAPRLDFARQPTTLAVRDGGVEVEDTHDPIVLRAPGVEWELVREGIHDVARAVVRPKPGEPVVLELRYGTGSLAAARRSAAERMELTRAHWERWASVLTLPETARELAARSAVVLKGLCHAPSGAILAAGTTSLPEHIGGVRNWDYRYCWLRDAAMSASSLTRLGSTGEAMALLDWVLHVVDECASPERLHPLYTVTGAELGVEAEITELAGYRGSRPVRVGNGAARQVQLDVFGPVVELIEQLSALDAPLSSDHWRLTESMVEAVARRWEEPDHGIWEIRSSRRHHVHSKVMCWVTVDRAVTVAQRLRNLEKPGWCALRDAIRDDVLTHGYKESVGAFTAAYDGEDMDAASLFVGLSGLLDPTDPRFVSTVERVEGALREDATVYRYRGNDDGLPGTEGGFHINACWLAQSLIRIGRVDEARALFDSVCALAGPTGILSEQHDPETLTALGNTPQAYSHLAVIDTALELEALGS